MAGTQTYWLNGQPVETIIGDGTQTYWLNGSPIQGIYGTSSSTVYPSPWANVFEPNPVGKPVVSVARISEFAVIVPYFAAEALHDANWYQPLAEPIPPPRIHVSVIPYSAAPNPYFGPEAPHPPVFQPPNHLPPGHGGPNPGKGPNKHQLRFSGGVGTPLGLEAWLSPFEFFGDGLSGIERSTMDKWYQPLAEPGIPPKIHVSELPYTWLVQFEEPIFPIPSVATWFQELAQPGQPPRLGVYEIPFTGYVRLPAVYGCIEAEITQHYIPRGRPVVQMPILYITRWHLYSTAPPPCATTYQSPGDNFGAA